MKEILRELVAGVSSHEAAHVSREYLQASILDKLQGAGAMRSLAFVGGTALRFLYGMQRYSEDLDFTLADESSGYSLEAYVQRIVTGLRREGFPAEGDVRARGAVHSARLRFPGLPHDLGLSPQRTASLMIKIEIDARPPDGAALDVSVVRKHGYLLRLQHHDRASLLAGKLHAVLARSHAKGRDYYDLLWYLSDRSWPEPNLTLLNNALQQTGWTGPTMAPSSWRGVILRRIQDLDWETLHADVAWLLQRPEEVDRLDKPTLTSLLEHRPGSRGTPPPSEERGTQR